MKLHVNVTQEDIDEGCVTDGTGMSGGCMVWRAFNRATEGAFPNMAVGFIGVVLDSKHIERMVSFPEGVTSKIIAFDMGSHVDPFAFDLELPDSILSS